MPHSLRSWFAFSLSGIGLLLVLANLSPAEEVWSGLTYSFTHPANSSVTDEITPNVVFNRGGSGGLFNAASESAYSTGLSPEFTQWATEINNPFAEEVSLDTRHDLVFSDFATAYGGPMNLATNITAVKAIVFLEFEEIYLELKFQTWGQGQGSGGAFSYLRSAPPVLLPTGDYNGNFKVDAADYTIWRDTLGSTTDLRANGDNTGASAGVVDLADYGYWKQRFGNDVPAGAGSFAALVPEPASALLLLVALSIMTFSCRISPRGPGQGL